MPSSDYDLRQDSQHTFGHIACPACARARCDMLGIISADTLFSEAATLWLDSRSLSGAASIHGRFLRESTAQSYRGYIDSLNLFFGQLTLDHIHLGHLRQYQEARLTGAEPFVRYRRPQDAKEHRTRDGRVIPAKGKTPCPAQPKKVNQELSILKMILRRAGLWHSELEEFYESLAEDRGEIPRALSPEEQHRWLSVAASRPEWSLVYWYSVLAFETSMSTNELRSLHIGDVNMVHRVVCVPSEGAKNRYRQRTITIDSAQAEWASEQLLARARDLGAIDPRHFLFPFSEKRGEYDPTRPMTVSGIKRQWNELRSATCLPQFRPYDTRHTAITRWAENGVAPEIIRARAGHVSERMMLHYTHIYEVAQRRAMQRVPHFGPQRQSAPFYVSRRVS